MAEIHPLTQSLEPLWYCFPDLTQRRSFTLSVKEIGHIDKVSSGIAQMSGLPRVKLGEVLRFENGISGLVLDIDEQWVGIAVLGDSSMLMSGMEAVRRDRVLDIPVGSALIGRVINPLGQPLDGKGTIRTQDRMPVFRQAPAIMDRAAVTEPLQTGIKAIDALIPIGRGQRELILGDRKTGKTAIAIDTIINQQNNNIVCIYCAIGQRTSSVAQVIADLKEQGAMDYSIVMVAEGEVAAGLYIAPYAAMSIGEQVMQQGGDALVVFDDLTKHARAYRELSLLLRRPPGREAYPGDIFHIHSTLLERATHLRTVNDARNNDTENNKGGSLTALPIIETQAQDISAYIPTNLISITDGQIYLSPDLFAKGVLPAIDIGKSVSRIGGKTQLAAYRSVAGDLKLSYSQFEEVESFARFGAKLDKETKKTLEHGKRIRECLKQRRLEAIPVPAQLLVLLALTEGRFDEMALDEIVAAENNLREAADDMDEKLKSHILQAKELGEKDRKTLLGIIDRVLKDKHQEKGSKPSVRDTGEAEAED